MQSADTNLITPIFIKTSEDMVWPEDEKFFYVLAANGLFVCRNTPFFRSCVPARDFPSELAEQNSHLKLRYPKVPRRLLELIVGFFARIGKRHGSEAGVLLVYDQTAKRYRLVVPPQTATVSVSWRGTVYPIGLHYETPGDLPKDWLVVGDVHSHVDEAAYASGTDKWDEKYRAGLHIVVGRLYREPPEFHLEAVVDGTRFEVPFHLVFDGYRRRRLGVPAEWLDRVKVDDGSSSRSSSKSGSYGTSSGYVSYGSYYKNDERDRKPWNDDKSTAEEAKDTNGDTKP